MTDEETEHFYKGLRLDWTDCFTGENLHRKGRRFNIEQHLRRERLCSEGLLHASRELINTFKTINPQQFCIVEGVPVLEDDEKVGLYEYRVLRRMTHKEIGEQLGMKFDLRPITVFFQRERTVSPRTLELLRTWASVWDSVRGSVRGSVWASVWGSVRGSVWASVWASVWDSVRGSVWASVWASVWGSVRGSVRDSVRDSVWAYMGSLFTGVTKWRYVDHPEGEYPFASAAELIRRGLMPVYDKEKWYLLSGPRFKIVWSDEI